MKKAINLILAALPLVCLGFYIGEAVYNKGRYGVVIMGAAMTLTVIRVLVTGGQTKIYTSEDIEKAVLNSKFDETKNTEP